jgi:hypothetical protein
MKGLINNQCSLNLARFTRRIPGYLKNLGKFACFAITRSILLLADTSVLVAIYSHPVQSNSRRAGRAQCLILLERSSLVIREVVSLPAGTCRTWFEWVYDTVSLRCFA